MWHWLLYSDGGLATRVLLGTAIFLILALFDVYQHGREARRWREYLFLLGAVAAAMVYGVFNDQITSRISWEYFYYGKGLAPGLHAAPPVDPRLYWQAAQVGMKATWTVGLLIGVALLLANNPGRRTQLPYRHLVKYLAVIMLCAILAAAACGLLGYLGWPAYWSEDFRQMIRHDEFRPRRFMCVYGIHLGGYIGGLLGTILVVALIQRRRAAVKAL